MAPPAPRGVIPTAERVKDPVCGLPVERDTAQKAGRTSEYQGKTYYFDTDGCKQRFDKDPQHYLSGSRWGHVVVIPPHPEVPPEPRYGDAHKRPFMMRTVPQESGPGDPCRNPSDADASRRYPAWHACRPDPPYVPWRGPRSSSDRCRDGSGAAAVSATGTLRWRRLRAAPRQRPRSSRRRSPQAIQPQPPQKTPSAPQPASPTCPPGHGDHQHD